MSSFCTNCGTLLAGPFCTSCGKANPSTASNGVASTQNNATHSVLFADRVAQEAREQEIERRRIEQEAKAKAAIARAEKKKEQADARKARMVQLKSAILRRKAVWFPIFSIVFLGLGYSIAQSAVTSSNGPDKKLEQVVTAIQTANFDALNDDTLFPGGNGYTPSWMVASYNKEMVASAEVLSVSQDDGTATATIGLVDTGEYFSLSLASDTKWDGIFQVPTWYVTEIGGEGGKFKVDSSILKYQKVSFVNLAGGKDKSFAAKTVGDWEPMDLLPGFYSTNIQKYGFSTGGSFSTAYWPSDENGSDLYLYSSLEITTKVSARADKKADYTAARCGNKKCSRLPKYSDYDFDLWSNWDYSEYTYSTFTYDWDLDYCTQNSATATSPTIATFNYTCSLTADAHLYVKYIYYYGYYNDYYYYGNYYDSTTDTITVQFNLRTDKSGK